MAFDSGFERLERRLKAIPVAVREAVKPALLKSGDELADAMRTLAEPSRDTGDLIDSITVTGPGESTPPYSQPGGSKIVPDNAVVVTVGNTNVRYPHLVEYGTRNAPAQPFFWPAYRIKKTRLARRIKRAISKAVREAR